MSQNRKNGQTTQTSNVKTARLLWVNDYTAGTNYIRFYPSAIKAVGYSDHQRRAGGQKFSSY